MQKKAEFLIRPMIPVAGQSCEVETAAPKKGKTKLFINGKLYAEQTAASGSACFKVVFERAAFYELRAECGGRVIAEGQAAVTARHLYFPWFGCIKDPEMVACRYANMVLAQDYWGLKGQEAERHPWPQFALRDPDEKEIRYWKKRGALACAWKASFQRNKKEYTEKDLVNYLEYQYADYPFDGVMIDELGGYDYEKLRNSKIVNGLKEFCRRHPDQFLSLWICGALKDPMSELVKRPGATSGFDLLMLEVYFNYKTPDMKSLHPFRYLQEGIDSAHRQDILPQCVFTIGIHGNYDKYEILPEELEPQYQYIRYHAPSMPGIGFYAAHCQNRDLVGLCDRLCEKYFIRPVITAYPETVWVTEQPGGAELNVEVLNIGGTDSGPVKVRFYDGNPAYGTAPFAEQKLAGLPAPNDDFRQFGKRIRQSFKTRRKGFHEIWIELCPARKDDTVLEGVLCKKLYVR
ncbi:MAG: hypothetical protein E7055_15210 [Lentisphaerae bacterium]|nr:hypothetical protein [Lentisphaerota bacterium]